MYAEIDRGLKIVADYPATKNVIEIEMARCVFRAHGIVPGLIEIREVLLAMRSAAPRFSY